MQNKIQEGRLYYLLFTASIVRRCRLINRDKNINILKSIKKVKKTTLFLAVASLSVIAIQSCKKEEQHPAPITETFSIELKANQSYTFTLPKNKRDDSYEITTQSTHYVISEVGKDASGNRIYQYTPSLNYIGADQVVLANPKEGGPEDHGNCKGKPRPHLNRGESEEGEEDHYIITINFTIDNSSSNK